MKKFLLNFEVMEMIVNLRLDFERQRMRKEEIGVLDAQSIMCYRGRLDNWKKWKKLVISTPIHL